MSHSSAYSPPPAVRRRFAFAGPVLLGRGRRPGRVAVAALLAAMLVGPLGLVGCDNPPRGDRGGRVGTTDTHRWQSERAQVLPASLIEFSDMVAERLARDIIEDTPRITDADERVTVILGDINNRTQIVSSNDFEMMLRRTRNNLNNAPVTRDRLRFVEDRARMQDLAEREGIAREDGTSGPDLYDPETTYTLNGDFFRVSRGGVNLYYMEVQVSHFATNEQVFSTAYESQHATE